MELLKRKIVLDGKLVIIVLLAIFTLKFYFSPKEVVVKESNEEDKLRIELLSDSIDVLQAAIECNNKEIKRNENTIDSFILVKRKDSIKLSNMDNDDKLYYFKEYIVSNVNLQLEKDSVSLNNGYISGANNIFLDHNLKSNELELVYENVNYLKSINATCVSIDNIHSDIANITIDMTERDVKYFKELNKQYKQKIRKYQAGGVLSILIVVLILI